MPPFTKRALTAAALFGLAPLALAQASNNDPNGKTLFLSQPACDSYQCVVQWPQCSEQLVQWLNPPNNNLWAALNARDSDTSYNITNSVAPTSTCSNITTEMTCGEYNFTVGLWTPGNYSVSVSSLDDPSIAGYSDLVEIVANDTCTEAPSSASAASGSASAMASSAASMVTGSGASMSMSQDGDALASASSESGSSDSQGSGAVKTTVFSSLAAGLVALLALGPAFA